MVLLHWRQYAQVALYPTVIVVMGVTFNHPRKYLMACKPTSVISLAFEDFPEAPHRAIVDTFWHDITPIRNRFSFSLFLMGVAYRFLCGVGYYRISTGLPSFFW